MAEDTGLRERKRLRTYRAISDAAIALFLERGFDQVSVAEVAEVAEVSKPTLFKYFPTKEDLVLARFADHINESAQVVRSRPAGESPITALRRHFLAGLAAHEATVGLDDSEQTLAFQRLFFNTPSLMRRLRERSSSNESLAEVFRAETGASQEDPLPEVAALQIDVATQALHGQNLARLLRGERAAEVYPDAVRNANRVFDLLENGFGGYCAGG